MTEMRQSKNFALVCEEQASILKMVPETDFSGIWVATANSTLNYWVRTSTLKWESFLTKFLCVESSV
jgi:hypothetical protein